MEIITISYNNIPTLYIYICTRTQDFGAYYISPEPSLLAYGRLGPEFKPLAPLDISTWAFKGGFCTYMVSTKISCAGPYILLSTFLSIPRFGQKMLINKIQT